MTKKKKRTLICTLHDYITDFAEQLKCLDLDKKTHRTKVKTLANAIMKATAEAKDAGQDMEDRLQEYYDAIHELGFERKKK